MNINELAEKTSSLVTHFKVTRDVYDSFQKCSQDMNPLHTDKEFASSMGFNQCVMYGNILNAFVSYFVGMELPTPEVMILTQDINYRKPFYMDDEIVLEAKIEEMSDAAGYVLYKLKFKREDGDKYTLIANGHVRVGLLTR
jgi:acyl dehydratase